jgi:hypothetical protein
VSGSILQYVNATNNAFSLSVHLFLWSEDRRDTDS